MPDLRAFTLSLTYDPGSGWVATTDDRPGALGCADTIAEATRDLSDAIDAWEATAAARALEMDPEHAYHLPRDA